MNTSLSVTINVKGIWRVRFACWLANRALRLVEWAVGSLRLEAEGVDIRLPGMVVSVSDDRTSKRLDEAVEIISSLRRGACWCDVGIGSPLMQDHSDLCKRISVAMKQSVILERR